MTNEELQEKLEEWLGAMDDWDEVLKIIELYAAEERSEGYSIGWDDGHDYANARCL